ncbi:MAG: hypothetical protein F9K29_17635 [Hyphomicrobiaceae bacterium]|nr:MAG: hypothetical protein F9K29_17635 [Hyphomicrobiaceae bacterium]
MRTIIVLFVLAMASVLPAQAAETNCKGLTQDACTKAAGCIWLPERKAGEKSAKTGQIYKTSAQAHCASRKDRP